MLAWLDGEEPATSRVEEVLPERPTISWINLVEVYYCIERDHSRVAADDTLRDLRARLTADLPGTARTIEAGRIKAWAPIALADCFAIATATALHATLLTGDPEILELDDCPCEVEDLRPASTIAHRRPRSGDT